MDSDGYPWYAVVQGEDLAQGDLFDRCPVFLPPADMVEPSEEASFSWQERDLTDNTPRAAHRGLPARLLTAFDVRAATRGTDRQPAASAYARGAIGRQGSMARLRSLWGRPGNRRVPHIQVLQVYGLSFNVPQSRGRATSCQNLDQGCSGGLTKKDLLCQMRDSSPPQKLAPVIRDWQVVKRVALRL